MKIFLLCKFWPKAIIVEWGTFQWIVVNMSAKMSLDIWAKVDLSNVVYRFVKCRSTTASLKTYRWYCGLKFKSLMSKKTFVAKCMSCDKIVKYDQVFYSAFLCCNWQPCRMTVLSCSRARVIVLTSALWWKKNVSKQFQKKTLSGCNSSANKTGLTLRRIVKIRNKKLICVQKKYFANLSVFFLVLEWFLP